MSVSDKLKPIVECEAESCASCDLTGKLHCHFTLRDLFHFMVLSLPPFLIGGASVLEAGRLWLVLYLLIILGYFGFLEIRVMCSHCPHYAEEGSFLRCWANHGAPKIWKYRPGPMSFMEKFLFIAGMIVVYSFPLTFFIIGRDWFYLLLYLLTASGFWVTLKLFFCTQCFNFACPFNKVPDDVRKQFFDKNPEIGRAWE